ncbi:hypothetical protein NDU88_000282 [Pleurodeles waltl]|uniref:Uncharacterized protein n=1 Tax=Pleurodeles waltl TaxID=8319 RepID=A0AAV7SWK6_PLEWA|nr:hypothetical protein NDU88_000282 [Pleurodeles waltl]
MNLVADLGLDRLSRTVGPAAPTALRSFMDSFGLVDLWREQNPGTRQFTYYSVPHNCSSRLDYLFTAGASVSRFREAMHYSRGISDHFKVGGTLIGQSRSYSVPPRLDPWHLRDNSFADKMRERATQYFEENLVSVVSACTLWETFKTVISGHAQDVIGTQKKERNMQAANIEREIATLKARFAAGGEAECDLQHQL